VPAVYWPWRAGEILVRGKGSRSERMPLPADAGEAIAAYLRDGRPASGCRAVFLGARAPFSPATTRIVSSKVRRACRRAGIPEIGSHRLRHTTACAMEVSGAASGASFGRLCEHALPAAQRAALP
jgi:integrase